MLENTTIDAVLRHIDAAIEEPGSVDLKADPESLTKLREDLAEIGFLGMLVAISGAPAPTEEVFQEMRLKVAERLREAMADDPPAAGDTVLADLLEEYRGRVGAKGPMVIRRLIERALFDYYDLAEHALFVDDVGRALDVIAATRGERDNARTFIQKLTALSKDAARFILGLFPEQISLIYRVGQGTAEPHEIDRVFEDFAPRAIAKRVPAVVKALIQKEKRFRLALTLYARSHGVDIARDHVLGVEQYLEVKELGTLTDRLLECRQEVARLADFDRAHADQVRALEAAY